MACAPPQRRAPRALKQALWGRAGCRLTIARTHSGPGHHYSEAASQARTSRAAGSLTTSPGPGERRGHSGLWGQVLGLILGPPSPGGSSGSRDTFLAAGLRSVQVGRGATIWLLLHCPKRTLVGLSASLGWSLCVPSEGGQVQLSEAEPILTALKDASRGQWPKQCCRKR